MPAIELSTRTAATLDDAWSNFDPQTPLPPGHPFYVERRENPLDELIWALRQQVGRAAKYFFAGHRGCGKSTELLHINRTTRTLGGYCKREVPARSAPVYVHQLHKKATICGSKPFVPTFRILVSAVTKAESITICSSSD